MELKFKITNFSGIRAALEKSGAAFQGRFTEHYAYLENGKKLTKRNGRHYLVAIGKRGRFFRLKHRKITKGHYAKLLESSIIRKKLTNRRSVYKLGSTKISFNSMEMGNFVILDGREKEIMRLKKLFRLKRTVTKPFSEL